MWKMEETKLIPIRSVNDNQQQIINDILKLHNGGNSIDLDCTYSKGIFYKNGVVTEPTYKTDLTPVVEGCIESSSTDLPFEPETMQCVMFDPPFVIAGKTYKDSKEGSSRIAKRFSAYVNWDELKDHWRDTLTELHRIVKPKGIVIMKLQNTISSGKQHMSHYMIMDHAIKTGFYPKDEFVLLSKSKMTSFGGRWKNQVHAMKHHSYFMVFEKRPCRVNYD